MIDQRIKRDFKMFDLLFIPTSLFRFKKELEENLNKKFNNFYYIPIAILEIGRLGMYCNIISQYLQNS